MEDIRTHSFISDLQLDYDLLQGLKLRKIEQKHLYREEGAKIYYAGKGIRNKQVYSKRITPAMRIHFLEKQVLKKKDPFTIISLGCGGADPEKEMLNMMKRGGHPIKYVGVDSSQAMVRFAEENLKHCNIEREMICADFTTHDFVFEMKKYSDQYSHRVFCLFGSTIFLFGCFYTISFDDDINFIGINIHHLFIIFDVTVSYITNQFMIG